MKNKIGTILLICSMWGSVVWGQSYRFPFQNPQLNEEARLDNLISLLTLDEKVALFGGAGIPRLGIRGAGSSEALHGIVQGGPAWNPNQPKQITTSFPQAYGLGATWDVELIQQVADYIAYEGRYLYQSPKYQRAGLILWSPNADLGRDIRWGRTEECYGEDPVLTAALTVAFVKGLQGSHPKYWKSASLMKHFLANSHESGRVETSSDFDETLFREYYSYPFWKGIELGGANALMTAYNAYNGIPCTISPVLRKVLQKEWGFDGMIITDGGAFQQLKNTHKVFERLEDAAQACIKAGTTRFLDDYKAALKNAFYEGKVCEKELEENIKGNLRIMLRLGLLDDDDSNPYKSIGIKDTIDPWLKEETRQLVRLAAQKSAVLLKNEGRLLPLDKGSVKRIAVIGNRADVVLEDWYSGAMPYKITPLAGLKEVAEREGIEIRYVKDNKRSAAEDAAAWADVAIVCLGNDPTGSQEWAKAPWGQTALASDGREDVDRTSLQLEQEDLLRSVYKKNPRTVLVLISSFPYAINWSQDNIPAILHFTQSCQELGHAVSDVIFGDYNPAGRTTQTWVKDISDLPHIMDYDIRKGRTYMYFKGKPLYAFGHGLSYTSFDYSHLQVEQKTLSASETLHVRFNVTNTGEYSGDEVVQVYVKLPGDVAAKRLKGFSRVFVEEGKTETVEIQIPATDLMLWNAAENCFKLPKGKMELMVGSASDNIKLGCKIRLQ